MEAIIVRPVQCVHVCHYPGMHRIYGDTMCSWCGKKAVACSRTHVVLYDDMANQSDYMANQSKWAKVLTINYSRLYCGYKQGVFMGGLEFCN
jgi:hypothetical protein